MDELRTQAEAFLTALEIGAVSVDNVVAWAQGIVVNVEHPHWAFCELATLACEYPQDLRPYLQDVPGVADSRRAHGLVLRMLARSLEAHPERADQVARSLYHLALGDGIEDQSLREIAWWAWDALDLADARIIAETRLEVVAQMQSRLVAAAELTGLVAPAELDTGPVARK